MGTPVSPQSDLKLDLLAAKLETLASRIDGVSSKVEAASAKADLPKEQKQPWWTTLTAILGIPGLILLMYLQFSQGGEATANTQKSIAETEKIHTEELKARADLQAQLEVLAEKKSQGFASYQKELNETLPKLQQTIERLNATNLARQQLNRDLLTQYVLLWIFIWGIGLVFDLISVVWNGAISVALGLFYSLSERDTRFTRRIRKIVNVAMPVLSPAPHILRLAVQVIIFFALFRPLFDQVAASTGSNVRLHNVSQSIRALRIGEAVSQVRSTLFP